MTFRPAFPRAFAATCLLAASPAFAHHAMEGRTPSTLMEGLLSGFAHPVIGLDHLAFVLALAWLVSTLPSALRTGLAAAFVGGSLVGTALHLQSVDVPVSELLVALTVLAAGVVLALRRRVPSVLLWAALPLAGVLHGYAYGESIVGAESTPLGAYLVGFAVIQFVLVTGVAALLARLEPRRLQAGGLVAGLAVAAVGLYFSFVQLAPVAA